MRNVSDKFVEKIKTTRILHLTPFFQNVCRLWDNVEKNDGAREATNDNTVWCWISKPTRTRAQLHAHAPTHTHTHTHKELFNTYCFSTAIMLPRRLLIVTLYVHWLSCYSKVSSLNLCGIALLVRANQGQNVPRQAGASFVSVLCTIFTLACVCKASWSV